MLMTSVDSTRNRNWDRRRINEALPTKTSMVNVNFYFTLLLLISSLTPSQQAPSSINSLIKSKYRETSETLASKRNSPGVGKSRRSRDSSDILIIEQHWSLSCVVARVLYAPQSKAWEGEGGGGRTGEVTQAWESSWNIAITLKTTIEWVKVLSRDLLVQANNQQVPCENSHSLNRSCVYKRLLNSYFTLLTY